MSNHTNTQLSKERLEPCPFCGAAAVLRYEGLAIDAAFDSQPYGRISCAEGAFRCCPELQFESSKEAEAAAIKEWNTRAVLAIATSLVKDGGGLAPERLVKRVCKDGFIDCGYHPKSESREVEYVRADLLHASSTEGVGHPRINGWPCVCAKCVSERSQVAVAAPQGDACPACGETNQFKPMCDDPECWVCKRLDELWTVTENLRYAHQRHSELGRATAPVSPSLEVEEVAAGEHAHCWHERREASSLCCDCEDLRDFLHLAATPVPPSNAAHKAAREIMDVWKDWLDEDDYDKIAAIISRYLPVVVEEGDEHD